jgi:hypothetical protein
VAGGDPTTLPAVFLFYKKSKPKERTPKAGGFVPVCASKEPGQRVKYTCIQLKKNYKNKTTREQNFFSYASVVLRSPDELGTIRRSFRHKGFSKLIAAFYATPQEINSVHRCWRYHFLKFKTIKEFYNSRPIEDPRFKTICDALALQ